MSGLKKLATKSATKTSKKSAPAIAKSFKSAEFIQDSEDEEVGNVATKHRTTSAKRNLQEPSPGEIKASLKGRSALVERARKPPSSALNADDGDSDSLSNSEGESYSGSPEINGSVGSQSMRPAKRSSSTSSSSPEMKSPSSDASGTETSADDVEEISTPTPAGRRKVDPMSKARLDKHKQRAPVTEISSQRNSSVEDLENTEASQNESDNETEGSSEGQSGSGSSESGSNEEPRPVTRKESTVQPTILPYVPPPGFDAATISSNAPASHTELFSSSNLQGKQIWHITVPSSVPIGFITSVAKKSVQDGSAVLSYGGADYGLISEAENLGENPALLLPSDEDSRYRSDGTKITQTLHLRQLVRLSSIAHDIGAEDAGTQVGGTVHLRKPYEKPVPEQPQGLKMRYRPIGVPDSDNSDVESTTRQAPKVPEFRVPGSTKKRKRNEATDVEGDEATSPKKKTFKSNTSTKSAMSATSGSSANRTLQKSKSSRGEAHKSGQANPSIHPTPQSKTNQKPSTTIESPTSSEPMKPENNDHITTTAQEKVSSPTKEEPAKKTKRKRDRDLLSSNPKSDPTPHPTPSSTKASPVKLTPNDPPNNAHVPPPTNGTTSSHPTTEAPKPKKKKTKGQNIPKKNAKPTLVPPTEGHAPERSPATTLFSIKPQTNALPKKQHRKHKSTTHTTASTAAPPSTTATTIKTSQTLSHSNDHIPHKEEEKKSEIKAPGKLSKKSKIPGETVEQRRERRAEKHKKREEAARGLGEG